MATLTGLLLSGIKSNYLDESYYLHCGLLYIKGVCPLKCNPEHPPIAKYLYGIIYSLSHNIAVVRLSLVGLAISTLYLVFYSELEVAGDYRGALLSTLLLGGDMLVVNVWLFALLDNISLLFLLISLLFFFKSIKNNSNLYLITSAIFVSLSFYSKFITLFYILSLLLLIIHSNKKVIVKYNILTYLSLLLLLPLSYMACIVKGIGFYSILEGIKSAFLYHEHLHGPRLLVASISLLKLLTGLEVWKLYTGRFVITNSTLVAITGFHRNGLLLEYPLNEYAPFPAIALVYGVYYIVKHRREMGGSLERLLIVASLYTFTLLGLLDPIAWYYLPLHYFAAMAIPLFFRRWRGRVLVLGINTAYLVTAWLLGLHYHARVLEVTLSG